LLEAQWNSNDGPTFTKGIVFRTAGSPKEIFMLGDAILYAVRRAASTAIQNVKPLGPPLRQHSLCVPS
jgi:hypothetical protein